MARHRFGARGNVITFPLPVEDLLEKLAGNLPEGDDAVPRSGQQLGQMFRVVLKTNKLGRGSDEELKTLIHQAVVRRQAWLSNAVPSPEPPSIGRWWTSSWT